MEKPTAAKNTDQRLFRGLQLPVRVRTGEHDLVRDFYVPCLQIASRYDRAAGYFTSAGLSLAAQGLAHLIHNGGKIRLIASPVLHENDIDAIRRGEESRDDLIRQNAHAELASVEDKLRQDLLGALAWLIANQQLTIKLAVRTDSNGETGRGLYHEKLGVIYDASGDFVAFSGSSNETAGGLLENFERLDIHRSESDTAGHGRVIRNDFESLWNGEEQDVEVIDFTEAAEELLRPLNFLTESAKPRLLTQFLIWECIRNWRLRWASDPFFFCDKQEI